MFIANIGHALTASAKAMAGHSSLGRQFMELWLRQNSVDNFKINRGQYFLINALLFAAEPVISLVVPTAKFLWKFTTISSVQPLRLDLNKKKKEDKNQSDATDVDLLTKAISRATVPSGLSAEAYLDLGKKYKENGWISQSQEALRLAQVMAPANSPTAIESLRYLRTKVPRVKVPIEVEAENIRGYHAMVRGDLNECKTIFGKLMEDYPDFEWPYLNLATAYLKAQELTEAKFLLRKLLSINPDHVEAWSSLARIHAATFDLDSARHAAAEARALYNEDRVDRNMSQLIDCLAQLDEKVVA
jgi:predicted Zn-dependent protease